MQTLYARKKLGNNGIFIFCNEASCFIGKRRAFDKIEGNYSW